MKQFERFDAFPPAFDASRSRESVQKRDCVAMGAACGGPCGTIRFSADQSASSDSGSLTAPNIRVLLSFTSQSRRGTLVAVFRTVRHSPHSNCSFPPWNLLEESHLLTIERQRRSCSQGNPPRRLPHTFPRTRQTSASRHTTI
jgi:hypothetical protein